MVIKRKYIHLMGLAYGIGREDDTAYESGVITGHVGNTLIFEHIAFHNPLSGAVSTKSYQSQKTCIHQGNTGCRNSFCRSFHQSSKLLTCYTQHRPTANHLAILSRSILMRFSYFQQSLGRSIYWMELLRFRFLFLITRNIIIVSWLFRLRL